MKLYFAPKVFEGEMKIRRIAQFSNLHIIQSVRKLCIFSWLEQLWKKKKFFFLRGWGAGAIVEKLPRSWFLSLHLPPPSQLLAPQTPEEGVNVNITMWSLQKSCSGCLRLEHNVLNFSKQGFMCPINQDF